MYSKLVASLRHNSFCRSGGKNTATALTRFHWRRVSVVQWEYWRTRTKQNSSLSLQQLCACACMCVWGHRSRSSFSGSFSCRQLKLSEAEYNTHSIQSLQPDGHHHVTASRLNSALWRWLMKQPDIHKTCSSSLKNTRELDYHITE